MADTGKQSPLGVNGLGSILNNAGFNINPIAESYMGSRRNNDEYTFGKIVSDTSLLWLTWAINDGYLRGSPGGGSTLTDTTYNNLIDIKGVGEKQIKGLGNSIPDTYIVYDPAHEPPSRPMWQGQATTGYALRGNIGQGQSATWRPYVVGENIPGTSQEWTNHSVTQWGWVACHALQAWNEFNWNGWIPVANRPPCKVSSSIPPEYKEFVSSFLTASSFVNYTNSAILSMENSKTFLKGTFSNQDDLISADITGVTLATKTFGQDLINTGKTIDLSTLSSFGLPSHLLRTLSKYRGVSQDLVLALLASELTSVEVDDLLNGTGEVPVDQEQKIYGAFLVITGQALIDSLIALDCRTAGIETLADLLNVRKLFPLSYEALTVPVYNATPSPTNSKTYYPIYQNGGINSQIVQFNFGDYLTNIIPNDQALAAGAFSVAVRQIRNIESVDIQKFARVVYSTETTVGLPLTSGTDVPVSLPLANAGTSKTAIGSGIHGTLTMSDFFGSMSGLPYPWQGIYRNIRTLETTELRKIYQNLYLAVQWEQATATVDYDTISVEVSPGVFEDRYKVIGVTLANKGGGYLRENAAPPSITIVNGAGATASLVTDTNLYDLGSNGGGKYGRVTSVSLSPSGGLSSTVPTAIIDAPPGPGWPGMNSVVQGYLDQANAEIERIYSSVGNTSIRNELNAQWNILGTQLMIEQRARFAGIPPVPLIDYTDALVPYTGSLSEPDKDHYMNPYPMSLYNFIDAMPELSQNTAPHMQAQTIEAISNMNDVSGQSLVGQMRQERNQTRNLEAGINLDNNVPDKLSTQQIQLLSANGTAPGAISGQGVPSVNDTYTVPAYPGNIINGVESIPRPYGYVDPSIPGNYDEAGAFMLNQGGHTPGSLNSILNATNDSQAVVVHPLVPTGPAIPLTNEPIVPGALVPTNENNTPINLDANYTSSTMMPSSYTVEEAVNKVIECNECCWVT